MMESGEIRFQGASPRQKVKSALNASIYLCTHFLCLCPCACIFQRRDAFMCTSLPYHSIVWTVVLPPGRFYAPKCSEIVSSRLLYDHFDSF